MTDERLRHLAEAKFLEVLESDDESRNKAIDQLRGELPFLNLLEAYKVRFLWESYSDYMCASWLIVHKETLTGFVEWIGGGD